VERRFGWDTHGLARRSRGRTPARHLPARPTSSRWGIEEVSTRAWPRVGAAVHPASGRDYVTRPGPPGSTSTTTTRPWTSPYMEIGHVGVSGSCGTRAWSTRASRLLPYCWRCENGRCPITSWRMERTTPTPSGQDPSVTVAGSSWRPGEWLLAWTTTARGRLPSKPGRRAVGRRHQLRRSSPRTGERYILGPGPAGRPTSGELEGAAVGEHADRRRAGRAAVRAAVSRTWPTPRSTALKTRSGSSCPTGRHHRRTATGVVHMAPALR